MRDKKRLGNAAHNNHIVAETSGNLSLKARHLAWRPGDVQ